MLVWPYKDPDEVVDYAIDWANRLNGDVITSASFALATAAGLAIDSSEHNSDTISQVTISGGTAGLRGKVLCSIETENGQTLQQTATLPIRAR